jgi:phosphoadenosine phosphosulfate reductase
MEEIFKRHNLAILQFSGGKDSLAVLELCRPYLDKIIVAWVDTGAAFPHVVDFIYRAVKRVNASFRVVRPMEPQPLSIEHYGFPVDILPARNTMLGALACSSNVKMQSWFECCNRLIWQPMNDFVLDSGATLVIRGQKNSDEIKGVSSGSVIEGIEYINPIEGWGDDDTISFLEKNEVPVPDHLTIVRDSLDCYSCTAMADFTASVAKDRDDFVQKYYPLVYRQVQKNKLSIACAIEQEITRLEKLRI